MGFYKSIIAIINRCPKNIIYPPYSLTERERAGNGVGGIGELGMGEMAGMGARKIIGGIPFHQVHPE